MATRSERMQNRIKRLRKSGKVQNQYLADKLETAQMNPMDAALTSQARGGMALESGAAAGAAAVPAAQALAEAAATGNRASIAAAGQQLGQQVTEAGAQGAAAAEQANNEAIAGAAQAREEAQQAAMAEQVRRREQTMKDISGGLQIATQAASLVAPQAYGILKGVQQIGANKDQQNAGPIEAIRNLIDKGKLKRNPEEQDALQGSLTAGPTFDQTLPGFKPVFSPYSP